MTMPSATISAGTRRLPWVSHAHRLTTCGAAVLASLTLAACAVGPNYHVAKIELPAGFKEGATWQRSEANPQGALDSQWWLAFNDPQLSQLLVQSLQANQSIVSAEAAYRVAQAEVDADTASLFPVLSADLSGTRSNSGSSLNSAGTGATGASVIGTTAPHNVVNASLTASWEPDLWGSVRRQIESGKATAQAADATLAGERLSIAASVAGDYFALREDDTDIALLQQQQVIDARLLDVARANFQQGTGTNDELLVAEDTLESVISSLQTSKIAREQEEHAIAVLLGVAPANFALAAQANYAYTNPEVPLVLPSVLLQRRPDVVTAERTAAAANARIGVAEAAFFPTLGLSAEGGFEHNTFAHLFSLPSRVWTVGPDLAATLFDGGARTAAVHQAEATYDEDAANYKQAVLTAFQNVEDSLSSVNHLNEEVQAFQRVYQRNQQLFGSEQAQLKAGTASEANLLTQQLTLLTAEQSLRDAQGQVAQNQILLIKNLGGGWSVAPGATPGSASSPASGSAGGASADLSVTPITAQSPPPGNQ
jgi:NodT family efflux transporter outer membrane factor (OMF) lipoprotein